MESTVVDEDGGTKSLLFLRICKCLAWLNAAGSRYDWLLSTKLRDQTVRTQPYCIIFILFHSAIKSEEIR